MSYNPDLNWTSGVQVGISAANGTPVTDDQQVWQVMADVLSLPYGHVIEHLGDGIWLVTLPTSVYQRAELNGGEVLTASTGHVVEIPMP